MIRLKFSTSLYENESPPQIRSLIDDRSIKLEELHNFNNIEWQPGQQYFIAHPEIDSGLSQSDIGSQCALVIGPEGGFSNSEITVANKLKFKGINLGPRILRTETAPIVALSVLQYLFGDF